MELQIGDIVRFSDAALEAMHWRQADHFGRRLAEVTDYPYDHHELVGIAWLTGPRGASIESVSELERVDPAPEQRVLRDLLLEDGQEELAGRILHPRGERLDRAMAAVWWLGTRLELAQPVLRRMGYVPPHSQLVSWAEAVGGALDIHTRAVGDPDPWGSVRALMPEGVGCVVPIEAGGWPTPERVVELAQRLRQLTAQHARLGLDRGGVA